MHYKLISMLATLEMKNRYVFSSLNISYASELSLKYYF